MAPVHRCVWFSSSAAPSPAVKAGKADGWISLRWGVAGKLWQKDKEARARRVGRRMAEGVSYGSNF